MSRPKRGTRGSRTERPAWDAEPAAQGETAGFECAHCGRLVPEQSLGTSQRNHCPFCLWSVHVDIKPGDRSSLCRAPMEPIALWASDGDELRILHRCGGCGVIKPNRIAGDDSEDALAELV
ncbi:MAG: RNHCP domain-containing protein [Spirochaetota bacterium]